MNDESENLIPKHGGYENTVTWKLADLIYDITVLFCDKYLDRRDRTHDQMVQSARSGCQNLQEGSVDSAVSMFHLFAKMDRFKKVLPIPGTDRSHLSDRRRSASWKDPRGTPVVP